MSKTSFFSERFYQARFSHDDVEVLDRQQRYRGFVSVESLSLRHRLFASQDFGAVIQREIVRRREAAGVIVHDPTLQKFLLIEQFRAGALNAVSTPWQLEIIAGLIDDGEDAATCLQREALEEAGCAISQLELLYRYHPSTGASDEIYNLYVATADLSQAGGVHGEVSEGEDILVHVFDYAQLDELMQSDRLSNASLIIALQWLQFYLFKQHQLHHLAAPVTEGS